VTGLDQRVQASRESDKLSLSAEPHYCLSSRRTTYHGIPAPQRNLTPLGHAALLTRRSRSIAAQRLAHWTISLDRIALRK
jgi:hypothetical protein